MYNMTCVRNVNAFGTANARASYGIETARYLSQMPWQTLPHSKDVRRRIF